MEPVSYQFSPRRRSIFAEIYFPQRIATQGVIYTALEKGLEVEEVRKYLHSNVAMLLNEFAAYPHWFDPNRYGETKHYANKVIQAEARMNMCDPVFFGWSMYEVDGVFLKGDGKTIDEERTQVIRLMFKFEDDKAEIRARDAGHPEVYRAILYWVLSEYGHTDNYEVWKDSERNRFLRRHASWNKEKRAFAKILYPELSAKVAKWIVDCGLFLFGYLVRKFSAQIINLNEERNTPLEDQIWVASIFHLNINALAPRSS